MDKFDNIQYRKFNDDASLYLSTDNIQNRPFKMSQDRILNETTTLNSIQLSNDHFDDSYKFGQKCSDTVDNSLLNENNYPLLNELNNPLLNESYIKDNSFNYHNYTLYFKYFCHVVLIIVLIVFIITLIIILSN